MAVTAERKLSTPAVWKSVEIPEIDADIYGGYHLGETKRTIYVSDGPLTWEGGSQVLMPHSSVARFVHDYNASNDLTGERALKFITLRDDNEVRRKLDANVVSDSVWLNYLTRPNSSLRPVDGVDQQLVHRVLSLYGIDGELREICPVTIAPSGMVPTLNRYELEKRIGAAGLKRLEQLRRREIYEKDDQVVGVMDAFGNPQLTFEHYARHEFRLIPYSHHVYAPNQDEPERVGIRGAGWDRHDDQRCFHVGLDVRAGRSRSRRSVPLVRGEYAATTIKGPVVYFLR